MKSEYYRNPSETLEKYEIPEADAGYAMDSLQGMEELVYSYVFFLIS